MMENAIDLSGLDGWRYPGFQYDKRLWELGGITVLSKGGIPLEDTEISAILRNKFNEDINYGANTSLKYGADLHLMNFFRNGYNEKTNDAVNIVDELMQDYKERYGTQSVIERSDDSNVAGTYITLYLTKENGINSKIAEYVREMVNEKVNSSTHKIYELENGTLRPSNIKKIHTNILAPFSVNVSERGLFNKNRSYEAIPVSMKLFPIILNTIENRI